MGIAGNTAWRVAVDFTQPTPARCVHSTGYSGLLCIATQLTHQFFELARCSRKVRSFPVQLVTSRTFVKDMKRIHSSLWQQRLHFFARALLEASTVALYTSSEKILRGWR